MLVPMPCEIRRGCQLWSHHKSCSIDFLQRVISSCVLDGMGRSHVIPHCFFCIQKGRDAMNDVIWPNVAVQWWKRKGLILWYPIFVGQSKTSTVERHYWHSWGYLFACWFKVKASFRRYDVIETQSWFSQNIKTIKCLL